MKQRTPLYVPKDVKLILAQQGYSSYKAFANEHGYNPQTVRNVFNKYLKGTASVPRGIKALTIISDFYSLIQESKNNAIL